MSRANEIAQGLRDENGGLIGGLVVEDCIQAADDFAAGRPPPRMTSPSYDVWRARLAREANERREVRDRYDAAQREIRERVRTVLLEMGRPDVLADYEAQMAELDRTHPRQA